METDISSEVYVELHIPNFQTAIDFYKMLGFEVVWLKEEYLVMRKGKSILNFYMGSEKVYQHSYFGRFPKDTKRGYAVEIFFLEDDLEGLWKKIKDKVKVIQPLILKPWGRPDFRIEDPFGLYLRFGKRYDWINNKERIDKTK